jgi:hypothetical protein
MRWHQRKKVRGRFSCFACSRQSPHFLPLTTLDIPSWGDVVEAYAVFVDNCMKRASKKGNTGAEAKRQTAQSPEPVLLLHASRFRALIKKADERALHATSETGFAACY